MAPHRIRSPLPGTFYRRPAPDAPDFKGPGDAVAAGEVIGLVELMKTFNEVTADRPGRFRGYLAETDALVEAEDPVAEIET